MDCRLSIAGALPPARVSGASDRARHAKFKGPPQKRTSRKGKKQQILLSERAHKQVLAVKKNMQLILHSSTRACVTVAISTVPDGEYHCASTCKQTNPAHNLL